MGGLRKRLYDILNDSARKESIVKTRKETKSTAYGTSGAYGATAIAQAFKGADFPMTKDDIMQKYGDREIEYHKGRKEKVHDILENIPDEKFNSTVELEQAFHETLKKRK
ncbi:MAG: hypothetical protein ACD_20C00317G0020 [uncultured bacterium]|nr:MAG: hypothetical protein ACD_20C00317G0020 [uncultured bacterium]